MPDFPTLNRRQWLQVGSSSLLGITLHDIVAGRAASPPARVDRGRSVILVLLTGGPSQLDTLDLKPDAPAEIRGEFQPIATSVPGINICEHLPRLAQRMHHWALVRTLSHNVYDHLQATHPLLTGAPLPNLADIQLSRRNWPCYGSALNWLRPRADGIPNGVTLPHALIEGPLTWPGQHAGFLGPVHDPLLVTQDPNSPAFRMDTLSFPEDASPARLNQRRRLLDTISAGSDSFGQHQRVAIELLSSGKVAAAFRLENEPERIRDRYGRTMFGQSLLLARRLVQAGVPMIQANMGIVQTWDTHADNWSRLKNQLLPWLDQGLAALIDDLHTEGRLDDTLIIVTGEFGRTPRISTLPGQSIPGRDHWAPVYSGLFAGAGVHGGQVIGRSDRIAGHPTTTAYTPFDIGATVYQTLGVDPHAEVRDVIGRPIVLNNGRPMDALFRGT